MYPVRKMVAGSALAAAAVAGGVFGATMFGTANATTNPTPSSSTATAQPGDRGQHGNETALTGDNLAKATAAAKAAVPGATVDRAETDGDGAKYEVHLTKTDGSHVTVKLDASFKVTGTETGGPGGGGPGGRGDHGGGGPHQANGITETPLTGDSLSKATAAAKAAVPGGTVQEATTDADGAKYEVHMTKSDGTEVTVKLDADFKVTSTINGRG